MKQVFHLLHEISINFDDLIPINFIGSKKRDLKSKYKEPSCNHLGYLIKDGTNPSKSGIKQRWKCSKCKKRFGTDTNEWKLEEYKYKIQNLLYEIFIEGSKQVNIEKRWHVPQEMISRFKKQIVGSIFKQHPSLLISKKIALKYGVVYGDETFFGKRGNSNQEVIFCNENFEILSTEPVKPKCLKQAILTAFQKIPLDAKNRIRVLVTDGEPAYKSIALNHSLRILHVQQYHSRAKLGQITINKYKKFGPHILHYQIHTHWKFFTQKKKEIGFKWEIKFIQGSAQQNQGRPTIQQRTNPQYLLWVSKKNEYDSPQFQKAGSARVYVNLDSRKISLRKGSKQWMKKMLQPLYPIFLGKHITNNRIESKNSQIKRGGMKRKEPDMIYSDQLVQLQEFINQNQRLPEISLEGRFLYKYLMKETVWQEFTYKSFNSSKIVNQNVISKYL